MKKWLFLFPLILGTSLYSESNDNAKMPLPMMKSSQSTQAFIMIDPKSRSSDLKETFELLKKEKTGPKVVLQLYDGSMITNIVDFTVASSGTLLIVKYNGMQGLKYQVVNVEDVFSISHM